MTSHPPERATLAAAEVLLKALRALSLARSADAEMVLGFKETMFRIAALLPSHNVVGLQDEEHERLGSLLQFLAAAIQYAYSKGQCSAAQLDLLRSVARHSSEGVQLRQYWATHSAGSRNPQRFFTHQYGSHEVLAPYGDSLALAELEDAVLDRGLACLSTIDTSDVDWRAAVDAALPLVTDSMTAWCIAFFFDGPRLARGVHLVVGICDWTSFDATYRPVTLSHFLHGSVMEVARRVQLTAQFLIAAMEEGVRQYFVHEDDGADVMQIVRRFERTLVEKLEACALEEYGQRVALIETAVADLVQLARFDSNAALALRLALSVPLLEEQILKGFEPQFSSPVSIWEACNRLSRRFSDHFKSEIGVTGAVCAVLGSLLLSESHGLAHGPFVVCTHGAGAACHQRMRYLTGNAFPKIPSGSRFALAPQPSRRTRLRPNHWIQSAARARTGLEALRPAHAHTDAMEARRGAAFALAAVSSSMHTTLSHHVHTSGISEVCGGTGHVGVQRLYYEALVREPVAAQRASLLATDAALVWKDATGGLCAVTSSTYDFLRHALADELDRYWRFAIHHADDPTHNFGSREDAIQVLLQSARTNVETAIQELTLRLRCASSSTSPKALQILTTLESTSLQLLGGKHSSAAWDVILSHLCRTSRRAKRVRDATLSSPPIITCHQMR